VYAELRGFRGRTEGYLDHLLADTYIHVDWDLDEEVWRVAGTANQAFSERRRRQNLGGPRRILADFLIGAHALVNGYTLLTLDQRHYRAAFPKLKLQKI
jgi:predicted nucleic acid-binding protein